MTERSSSGRLRKSRLRRNRRPPKIRWELLRLGGTCYVKTTPQDDLVDDLKVGLFRPNLGDKAPGFETEQVPPKVSTSCSFACQG